jgi:UDP-glucose 4-epimerase
MRILVTGGAGFIGSHVVDAYVKAGHTVAVVDNFRTGKKNNIPAGVTHFEVDITNAEALRSTIATFKPEAVSHHAAQVSVSASVEDPAFDAQQNIIGMVNLLMALQAEAPTAKIIYASSGGAMYGVTEELPYSETATPAATAPYGLSKFVAEQYVWLFVKLHGMRATVLRYANVYGPRQDPHGEAGVCAIFAERMQAGQPVTIFGDGTATRDYVYVEDIAAANVAALTKGDGEAVNIATGIEQPTKTVFQELAAAFHYELSPQDAPLRPGEQVRSVLNPAKAVTILGWKAETSFKEGIAKTAAWYAAH